MGRRNIPDRWQNYKPLGERIEGTRFIAFKVPLKEGLVSNLPLHERFTTKGLMESVPNLGIVIDLTNTDRYYNSQDILGQGILYEKIFCRGHEIPSRSVVDKFFSAVDKYLECLQSTSAGNSDDKLIGVHCTHGLNRTGYLVCRYMIRKLGFTPQDAISAFEKARGYPIEREGYLENLRKNEDSPQSVENDESANSQNAQGGVHSSLSDHVQTNGFPDRCQDPCSDGAVGHSRGTRTNTSRSDDFQRFPADARRDGFRNFSHSNRGSFSWPSRNYRADFCNDFPSSSYGFRAFDHSYRGEFHPEERNFSNSRSNSRRFYKQDFDDSRGMRQHPYDHRSRSSSSFRDSVHHRKNNYRDYDQF